MVRRVLEGFSKEDIKRMRDKIIESLFPGLCMLFPAKDWAVTPKMPATLPLRGCYK